MQTFASADGWFEFENIPPGRLGLPIIPPDSARRRCRTIETESGQAIGYPVHLWHTGVEEEHWVEPVETCPGAELWNRVVKIQCAPTVYDSGRTFRPALQEPSDRRPHHAKHCGRNS